MSEITNLMPPPDADLSAARRQFVELYGTPLIAASYLRIALACVSLVCLGLLVLNIKTFQAFHGFKPLVIRINDVGRAEAVAYDSLTYQPQDAEVRYFLIEFVTKHYSRMRATVRENFARSTSSMAAWLTPPSRQTKRIEHSRISSPATALRLMSWSKTSRSKTCARRRTRQL